MGGPGLKARDVSPARAPIVNGRRDSGILPRYEMRPRIEPRRFSMPWSTVDDERRTSAASQGGIDDGRKIKCFGGPPQAAQGGGRGRRRRGSVRRIGRQPNDLPGARRGRGPFGEAAQGRVLQRRIAGDLVRAGQAGGGILGQAVQRRRHLVRRPARRGQAARRDRRHGQSRSGISSPSRRSASAP